MPPHKHPEDEKTKKDEKTKRQKKKVKNNPEGKPPCRHPGNFRSLFSLPLNASIRGPKGFKTKDKRLKKEPNSPLTTIRLQDKIKGEIF